MKEETMTNKNIFQRMLLATSKIEKVAKNLKVEISSTRNYKAVSEADVLNAVKPIEEECGIYSYPVERNIIENNVLTTVKEYNGNKTESNQLMMRLEVVYRFVNVDNPSEYIDIKTYGDGIDTGDKAPGKAMTYADKYALLKAYKIETGDDPDKEASGELKQVKKGKNEQKVTPYDFLSDAEKLRLEPINEGQKEIIKDYDKEEIKDYLIKCKKTKLSELTFGEAQDFIEQKQNKEKEVF